MPSKPTPYQVPFSQEGHQLHYAIGDYAYGEKVKWVDNFEFTTTLTIKRVCKGRRALYFDLVDQSNGKRYSMFMKDMMDVIAKCTITEGVVDGTWTFRKQGCNFGVKVVL